jgi:hypothetical protein
VGVEEVEAEPAGPGDRPEVDLFPVLDEVSDRGLGAVGGGLLLVAGGPAECVGATLGCGEWLVSGGVATAGG